MRYCAIIPGAKRARAFAGLKRDWKDVVGAEFSDISSPEKFDPPRGRKPGVIAVKAVLGAALILQHDAPRLMERINNYLGADAVGKISIIPGIPPQVKDRLTLSSVDPDALQLVESRFIKMGLDINGRLEKALARLSLRTGSKSK